MSKTVDERVVRMQFDNKGFQAAVSTTIKSLDELEERLDFKDQTKGFTQLSKAANDVDLSQISTQLDKINDRFSTLSVIGRTVIERLTNDFMNLAHTITSNGVISQILTGGLRRSENMAQAKFMMEGLGYAFDKTDKDPSSLYNAVSNAVDGTAYSLDQAARAASVFLSSGIADTDANGKTEIQTTLENIEDSAGNVIGQMETVSGEMTQVKKATDAATGDFDKLNKALTAIAGTAAMGNMEFDYVAGIFEGIQARGRVFADDLNRLSNSGLGVSAALAKSLGVTQDEVSSMVSKGQVDFDKFMDAMHEAFGDQAAKANETYAGSLANVKSALSRIGEPFWTGWRDSAKDVFNAIRPLINLITAGLNKTRTFVGVTTGKKTQQSTFEYFQTVLKSASTSIMDFLDTDKNKNVKTAFDNLAEAISALFIGTFQRAAAAFHAFKKVFLNDDTTNLVLKIAEGFKNFVKAFPFYAGDGRMEKATKRWEAFFKLLKGFITVVKTVLMVVGKLASGIVNVIDVLINGFDNMNEAVDNSSTGFEKFASVVGVIFDTIGNIVKAVFNTFKEIGEGFAYIFQSIAGNSYLMDKISGLFARVGITLDGMSSRFKNIFGDESLGTRIKNVLIMIGDFFASIGQNEDAEKSITILDIILAPFRALFGVIQAITGLDISSWFSGLSDKLGGITEKIKGLFGATEETKGMSFTDRIKAFFGSISDSKKEATDSEEGIDVIGGLLGTLKTSWAKVVSDIKDFKFLDVIPDLIVAVKDTLVAGISGIGDVLKTVGKVLKGIIEAVFGDLSFDQVINSMDAASLMIFVRDLHQLTESFRSGQGFSLFGNWAKALNSYFVSLQKNVAPNLIKQVSIAIAVMTGSIVILSRLSWGNAIKGVAALSIMLFAIVNVLKLLKGYTNQLSQGEFIRDYGSIINSASAIIFAFSAAILAIGVAIGKMENMDIWQITIGAVAIIGVLSSVVAMLQGLVQINVEDLKGFGPTLLVIAVAISIIGGAIKKAAATTKDGNAWNTFAAGLSLVAIVKILAQMMSDVSFNMRRGNMSGKQMISIGIALIGVAIGIRILAKALATLSNAIILKDNGEVQSNWKEMLVAIGMISAMMVAMGAAVRLAGTSQGSIGSAISFITMALALKMVITSVTGLTKTLSKYSDEKMVIFNEALSHIAGLLLTMGATVGIAGGLPNTTGKGKATGILAITLFVSVLLNSIKSLLVTMTKNDIDISSLTDVTNMLTMLLACVAGMIAVANLSASVFSGKGSLSAVVLEILAMALAIGALGKALEAIGRIEHKLQTLGTFLAAFVIALGSVVGAAIILQKTGAIIAISMLGTAVLEIGLGFAAAAVGTLLFVGAFIVFTAALVAGVALITPALGSIGVALWGLGEVLGLALGNLVIHLVKQLERGADQIILSTVNIAEHLLTAIMYLSEPIGTAIAVFIEGILDSLSVQMGPLVQSVMDFIIALLWEAGESIRNSKGKFWAALANICSSLIEAVIDFFKNALKTLFPILSGTIDDVFDTGKPSFMDNWLKNAGLTKEDMKGSFDNAKAGLEAGADQVKEAFTTAKDKLMEGIDTLDKETNFSLDTVLQGLAGKLGVDSESLSGFIDADKIKEMFGGALNTEEILGQIQSMDVPQIAGALGGEYSEIFEKAGIEFDPNGFVTNANDQMVQSVSDINPGNNLGLQIVHDAEQSVTTEEAIKSTENMANEILDGVYQRLTDPEKNKQFEDIGQVINAAIAAGLKKTRDQTITPEIDAMMYGIGTQIDGYAFSSGSASAGASSASSASPVSSGIHIMSGLASGILQGKKEVEYSTNQAVDAGIKTGLKITGMKGAVGNVVGDIVGTGFDMVKTTWDNSIGIWFKKESQSSGKDAVKGFSKGAKIEKKNAENTFSNVATASMNAINNTLEINSPSKKLMETGKFAVMGFTQGIEDNEWMIVDELDHAGEEAKNEVYSILDEINQILEENIEFHPVIKPVLDKEQLEKALEELKKKDSSSRSSLEAGISSVTNEDGSFRGIEDIKTEVENMRKITNNIYYEMKTLKEQLRNMNTSIDGMEVVMDTGALVGQIAAPMSDALDAIAEREGRGN